MAGEVASIDAIPGDEAVGDGKPLEGLRWWGCTLQNIPVACARGMAWREQEGQLAVGDRRRDFDARVAESRGRRGQVNRTW